MRLPFSVQKMNFFNVPEWVEYLSRDVRWLREVVNAQRIPVVDNASQSLHLSMFAGGTVCDNRWELDGGLVNRFL